MFRLIAIAAVFVSSPALAADQLTDEQNAAVLAQVSKQLLDPSSAEFSPLSASKQSTGEWIVCGQVNAKNRHGGYVGAAPFLGKLYDDGNFYLTKIAEAPGESENLAGLCRSYGLTLSQ